MLSISLSTAQRCIFHPNPEDAVNAPAAPGVGPDYLIADDTILSVDASGPPNNPDIVPIKPGTTIVKIRGAVAPGQPYITEDVEVTVTPGPFDHFAPTADAPRSA